MKKGKITVEQVIDAFADIPCGKEFTRSEIIKIVTDFCGNMEVIPSDYCYNRTNKGIDIDKNLKEHKCLFEYISRNKYKYIGAGKSYTGFLYCQPKGFPEYIAGKINNNVVERMQQKEPTMELKSNFNPLTATAAHENTILASPVLPKDMPAPFDHAWGYLDKPGEMERHRHPKEEVYFFFKGEGFVFVDGEEIPVQPGDVVRIPSDALHTVINRQNQELLWAALWWTEAE